jgi:hypothetical protein
MKATGKKINNMALVKKFGRMELNFLVIMLMERNKERVLLSGQMEAHIQVTS